MPVSKKEATEKLEMQRIKGKDEFLSTCCVRIIANLLANVGTLEIEDNDFYRAMARFMKTSEIDEIYDRIIPPERRQDLAEDRYSETPPEFSRGADADDILRYLGKNIITRRKMFMALKKLMDARLTEMKRELTRAKRTPSVVELRFGEVQKLFSLSDQELEAVEFLFMDAANYIDFGDFQAGGRFGRNGSKIRGIAMALNISDMEASGFFSESMPLRKYGLFDEDLDFDRSFLNFLLGYGDKPLAERFYRKVDFKSEEILPLKYYEEKFRRVGEEFLKLAAAGTGAPLHMALVGLPGTGKSSFVYSLAAANKLELYEVKAGDDERNRYSKAFRYAALQVCYQHVKENPRAVILVDECDSMLNNGDGAYSGFLEMLGVRSDRNSETKSILNTLLDTVTTPVIWIGNSSPRMLDEATRRRFALSLYCEQMSRKVAAFVWKNCAEKFGVTKLLDEKLMNYFVNTYDLSAGGISNSVRNAAAVAGGDAAVFRDKLHFFVSNHCAFLNIRPRHNGGMNTTTYDPGLINLKSPLQIPRLVEAARNYLDGGADMADDRPVFNVLLSGPSGSGKSEFARYLGRELERPVQIRNIADLQDKYVGECEKNIERAFREADETGAILVLDEIDSLLRSRLRSEHSWETSQTNALLQSMEGHNNGRMILVATTNQLNSLDPASLRRWTFKLQTDYFTAEQSLRAYEQLFAGFKLPALTAAEKQELTALDKLTVGDFKVVRQQFFYLGSVSNTELLNALRTEMTEKLEQAKNNDLLIRGRNIGF